MPSAALLSDDSIGYLHTYISRRAPATTPCWIVGPTNMKGLPESEGNDAGAKVEGMAWMDRMRLRVYNMYGICIPLFYLECVPENASHRVLSSHVPWWYMGPLVDRKSLSPPVCP